MIITEEFLRLLCVGVSVTISRDCLIILDGWLLGFQLDQEKLLVEAFFVQESCLADSLRVTSYHGYIIKIILFKVQDLDIVLEATSFYGLQSVEETTTSALSGHRTSLVDHSLSVE